MYTDIVSLAIYRTADRSRNERGGKDDKIHIYKKIHILAENTYMLRLARLFFLLIFLVIIILLLLFVDWGIYRARVVGSDYPILWVLHQFQRHSKIFQVSPVRELREIRFRGCHDLRVRLQSGKTQVFRVLLPL